MNLEFTEEQSMLRDAVASYLADHNNFDQRQQIIASGAGWSEKNWRFLAEEMGLLSAPFPETMGGLGGGSIETMILAEEFGKVLTLEPFIETVVIGGGFLKYSGHPAAADLIGEIISGQLHVTFAQAERDSRFSLTSVTTTASRNGSGWKINGSKRLVLGAPIAGKLIVSARTAGGAHDAHGISLFLVDTDAPGVRLSPYKTYDDRVAADVDFQEVAVPDTALVGEVDNGYALIDKVMSEAVAASCAEAAGVASMLLELTLEYTRNRKQFGKALAAFQTLQHRMVDMFTAVQQVTSMAWMSAIKVQEDDEQRRYSCAAAKAYTSRALRQIGQSAVQLHGGMGITVEMSVSHYFKRATVLETLYGSADYHLEQLERWRYVDVA